MARTEEGEFELILGNKQLLVVFFIVVVLLGVFFAMGYIVGKNTAQPEIAVTPREVPVIEPNTKPSPGRDPRPVERPTEAARPTPRTTATPVPAATPEPTRVAAAPTPKPKPAVEAEAPSPKKSGEAKAALASNGEPAPGQVFLQVVASTRPDCEVIVDVLKKKGFSAMVAPGPNEKLFRVLVGPLKDATAISKTRSDLEGAGFQKPILRKY